MPADTEAIHREMLLIVKCMNKDVPALYIKNTLYDISRNYGKKRQVCRARLVPIPIWIYNPITEPVWNSRISEPDTNRSSEQVSPVPLF